PFEYCFWRTPKTSPPPDHTEHASRRWPPTATFANHNRFRDRCLDLNAAAGHFAAAGALSRPQVGDRRRTRAQEKLRICRRLNCILAATHSGFRCLHLWWVARPWRCCDTTANLPLLTSP